jgi:hypothetical protein
MQNSEVTEIGNWKLEIEKGVGGKADAGRGAVDAHIYIKDVGSWIIRSYFLDGFRFRG